jgi:hypothetical protein
MQAQILQYILRWDYKFVVKLLEKIIFFEEKKLFLIYFPNMSARRSGSVIFLFMFCHAATSEPFLEPRAFGPGGLLFFLF